MVLGSLVPAHLSTPLPGLMERGLLTWIAQIPPFGDYERGSPALLGVGGWGELIGTRHFLKKDIIDLFESASRGEGQRKRANVKQTPC